MRVFLHKRTIEEMAHCGQIALQGSGGRSAKAHCTPLDHIERNLDRIEQSEQFVAKRLPWFIR